MAEALTRLGYPDLNTVRVIAPKYAHALKGWDDKVPLPGVTIKQPPRDAARQNRRDFERRMGAVEFRLGRHDRGDGQLGRDTIIGVAVGLPFFKQAHNYLHNPEIRAQVLHRILTKLPESGRLVIVGHSLGSVIAADLVRRLPVGLTVAGMVTIGSPLANGSFDVDKLRETLKEPPTNLAWWVNFWNAPDLVAAHRGASSVFPWMVDFRIDTKKVGIQAHAAVEYLSDEAVATAIGFALFGSRSKELAGIDKGLDIPVDAIERMALVALRYAHLLKMRLEGDQQDRFAGALRHVQAAVVDDIRRRNDSEDRHRRGMPSAIARLAFDLSDPHATVPEPLPCSHIPKDEAVVLLTILAAENVIRPFEISISKDKWQDAMKDLTAEMGLGSQYGADVFAAAKRAQEALSGGVNWMKWGALGASAALIVLATGGLALAAGAGLAGAAAITSALAAFGPGGMMGGLLTAGTLLTAGGSGLAFGLASAGTTAATLEAVVERQLAAAILRKLHDLEQDPAAWRILAETEIEVRREYERLDEFSDESSPGLKELKRKIETIERALKHLKDNGLEPDTTPSVPDQTE
ncbi:MULTISPECIES: alpha/beta hydrolase [unclassified Cryobacterium]|uniref:alpha/beta hydrolase n=1 Tax=unclassified Cryobacterium TaxID=2649013 RepID=UPI001F5440BC|nr:MULTISPECIES: alpha/beta hydrolase [unclassified Cryobacterium]